MQRIISVKLYNRTCGLVEMFQTRMTDMTTDAFTAAAIFSGNSIGLFLVSSLGRRSVTAWSHLWEPHVLWCASDLQLPLSHSLSCTHTHTDGHCSHTLRLNHSPRLNSDSWCSDWPTVRLNQRLGTKVFLKHFGQRETLKEDHWEGGMLWEWSDEGIVAVERHTNDAFQSKQIFFWAESSAKDQTVPLGPRSILLSYLIFIKSPI